MDNLKQKRQVIKGSITRIYTFCLNQNASLDEVKVRISKLDDLFAQYEEIQNSIDDLTGPSQDEESYRSEMEDKYFSTKSIFSNRVRREEGENTQGADMTRAVQSLIDHQSTMSALIERMNSTALGATSSPLDHVNSQEKHGIRLPHIQIPEFDGTYTEWIRFRDLFEAMINARSNLSGVEKFEYLQTRLKGDALSVVKHLKPTNENYTIAWELLHKKYKKTDKVKKAYLELLFDQPAMKSSSLSELKRIVNTSNEGINALKALNEPVDHWDSVLLFHIEKKIDTETLALWYRERKSDQAPTFSQFLGFLDERLFELESIQGKLGNLTKSATKTTDAQYNFNRNRNQSNAYTSIIPSCSVCSKNHALYHCNKFKAFDIERRIMLVRDSNRCFNCLQEGHRATECTRSSCRICNEKHNSLLHRAIAASPINVLSQDPQQQSSTSVNTAHQDSKAIALLPTAVVLIQDGRTSFQPCRVLLDSGAQVTLISETCAQRLELKRSYDKTLIYGVGANAGSYARGKVHLKLKAMDCDMAITTEALCVDRLTQNLPGHAINNAELKFFSSLKLADPQYNLPGPIDVILGVDIFSKCILPGKIMHPNRASSAMQTVFGWVIVGSVEGRQGPSVIAAHTTIDLSEQMQQFWRLEECNEKINQLSEEEEQAEMHFQQNVQRDASGRYIVRLPFKRTIYQLGDSRQAALRRHRSLESKFSNNSNLKQEYKQFIDEFFTLGHIEEANICTPSKIYFMPHHAVFKPSSTTTKLRVVFDASCKTDAGTSLNEQLLVGPTIQQDLFTILLQFRRYKIGFIADIEKMYRQILIHPDDRSYQRILWRDDEHQQIKEYDLKTVTYGTACAPFLATRTLRQVAMDNARKNPDVAAAIENCFYVDDFMSCSTSLQRAISLKNELCEILGDAGFHLRKWVSNLSEFINSINPMDRELATETVINDTQTVKALGLLWNTANDCFKYSVKLEHLPEIVTKRAVLSDICKIFDPIGWLSPIVVSMKILMQRLWLRGIGWDQPLPDDLLSQWKRLRDNVNIISELQIPRWLQLKDEKHVELHGFADSSELAYAAAVYLRVQRSDGIVRTNLVAAKTRVAPVKQITLPRLELCAAHLMVKLMKRLQQIFSIENNQMFGWSDSTVVLAWISDHPRRWKSFIANRTSYIINLMPAQQWRHIKSQQNPADLATRGIIPSDLLDNKLWWYGPDILRNHKELKPYNVDMQGDTVRREQKSAVYATTISEVDYIERYSDYNRLLRITTWILRFKHNCQVRNTERKTGFLSVHELQTGHSVLIKRVQIKFFAAEIRALSSNKQLQASHKLAALSPFVDKGGVLRVGGRIDNADIKYDQKHPLILHKDSYLTKLIVAEYHLRYLHAGTRQLQYLLGMKYWIPGVIHLIKQCVYKCVRCMRFRGKPFLQQMGNLPRHRLDACSAFLNTGVDFAGPIQVRSWKGRGSKRYKSWIAIFVCLVTKAIHLELVTELSTDAFIATLRRFVARRGRPRHMYSDNGTNFVGCNQKLREVIQLITKSTTQEQITREMTGQCIQWHFSPPSGPHFGGMWEAGVKSTKFHLNRVLGDASATFEEMTTVLCQIEGCLNSRPICLKFEGDIDPLTPSHFLILRSMESIPEEPNALTNPSYLKRWQYLQYLVHQFWNRWSIEYICQLQRRPKWSQKQQNLSVDDIIIIKEDLLPPAKWSIGRIVDIHPGKDGLVRVVSVKTKSGIYKRPIVKLCPLFLDV